MKRNPRGCGDLSLLGGYSRLPAVSCDLLRLLSLLGLFCLVAVPLAALNISTITWESNFEINPEALNQAGGLKSGQQYDPDLVKEAMERVETYLQESGRHFVKIPFPELIPEADSLIGLRFSITELLPSDQVELRLTGMRYFSEARLKEMLFISEERRFALSELPKLSQQILDACHQRGFLFAKVELDSLVMEAHLTAWLKVSEGKVFKAEQVFFEGNKHTRDSTLLKLSGIQSAPVITVQRLDEARQNILRKPYINEAELIPVNENSLLIRVDEGRMTFLEGVLGYTGKDSALSGLLKLKFLNLWGSDRSLNLNWRKDAKINDLELAYHESGPGSFPIAGDLLLKRSSQDTLWIKSSIEASIYAYHGYHRLGLDFGTVDNLIDPFLTRAASKRTASNMIGAFWSMDSAFPAANPARGWQTRLSYKFLHSKEQGWSKAFELENTNFIPLSKAWIGAVSINFKNLDKPEAKEYELYQMGGYERLRGYSEGELKSWRLGWIAWELRWRIDPNSRLHAFFDHGIMARHTSEGEIGYKTDLFGFGIGARIKTRLGIMGIDYALGKRETGISSLGQGMIHIGLDASF